MARAEGHCGPHTVAQHQLCQVGCLSVSLCVDKAVCRAADAVALWHETNGRGHVIQLVTSWQDVMVHHLSCKAKHDHQHHHVHICYVDLTNNVTSQCKSALIGTPYKHRCFSKRMYADVWFRNAQFDVAGCLS